MKIIKKLEIHIRIANIMKIIGIDSKLMKIIKILEIHVDINENHKKKEIYWRI